MKFTKLDFSNTLRIANKEGFYDASYIVAAEISEAILVTGDEKIKEDSRQIRKNHNIF